jgi:hypothetical protein
MTFRASLFAMLLVLFLHAESKGMVAITLGYKLTTLYHTSEASYQLEEYNTDAALVGINPMAIFSVIHPIWRETIFFVDYSLDTFYYYMNQPYVNTTTSLTVGTESNPVNFYLQNSASIWYYLIRPRFGFVLGTDNYYIKLGYEPSLGASEYYIVYPNWSRDGINTLVDSFESNGVSLAVGNGIFVEARMGYLYLQAKYGFLIFEDINYSGSFRNDYAQLSFGLALDL